MSFGNNLTFCKEVQGQFGLHRYRLHHSISYFCKILAKFQYFPNVNNLLLSSC